MILAKNIALSYDKKRAIIKNGHFHIKEKDFIFISGSSGSGKSTLLKALYGELAIMSGELYVNKIDLSKSNHTNIMKLRRHLGIIFQDYKLIQEYTIEENIKVPLDIKHYEEAISNKRVEKLLTYTKLAHRKGAYPAELSGGEQQRVAVARALAHIPDIILADEPTGNLDEYSANMIWDLLKTANTGLGITVIVVTHQIPKDLGVNYRRFNIDDGVVYEAS